jgi:hypothetical protein
MKYLKRNCLLFLTLFITAFNLKAVEVRKIRNGTRGHYGTVTCIERWDKKNDGTIYLERREIYCEGNEGNANCTKRHCGTKPGTFIDNGDVDGQTDFVNFDLTIAEKIKGAQYINYIESQLDQGVPNGNFMTQEIFINADGSTYFKTYNCQWQTDSNGVQTYSVSINN